MKHNRPLFTDKNNGAQRGLFAIVPIIPQIIIIAIVTGAYYYITSKGLFPLWSKYIYYGTKIIIGFEVLIASAKSLVVPLLAIGLGGLGLYMLQIHSMNYFASDDAWHLIFVGVAGLFLTFIVRSFKRS